MNHLTCCKNPAWVRERDVGQASGFDCLLGKCGHCGVAWMSVVCAATGHTGYERVAPDDLAKIRSTPAAMELKELLRQWCRKTLDPGKTTTNADHPAAPQNLVLTGLKKVLHIIVALALVFIAAVLAELPPMQAIGGWIQEREWPLLLLTGSVGTIGFTLMMGGILKLLMDQDETLSHTEVEDVERSVRMAARPGTWRASSYRVWGRAKGRRGSEQFTFAELKQAWRSGAVWHESVWRRRLVTSIGALMMTFGLLGSFLVMGPLWMKVLMVTLLLYILTRLAIGLWRA
jgi:hypothetical protein